MDGPRGHQIRPVPEVDLEGRFILCKIYRSHGQCGRGDRCTYAHSIEELEAWNKALSQRRHLAANTAPAQSSVSGGRPLSLPRTSRAAGWGAIQQPRMPQPLLHAPIPPFMPMWHNPGGSIAHPQGEQYFPPAHLQPPAHQPPLTMDTRSSAVQSVKQDYAARRSNFLERIEEELYLEDIQQELTPENYKKKFHNLLCWEEKTHIEILENRCQGSCTLVVYPAGCEPPAVRSYSRYKRCGHMQGLDGDQIAYATQASEAVVIVKPPDIEVRADILRVNFSHIDDKMYIGFDEVNLDILQRNFPLKGPLVVHIQFELKHLYFDNLHKALEGLPSEMINKIMPQEAAFQNPGEIGRIPFPKYYSNVLKLDDKYTANQQTALRVAVFSSSRAPPVLISGPFGTGKTRLLAAATYCFIEEGKSKHQVARVLICAHHQASADTFLECYFGPMLADEHQPWGITVIRLTSANYTVRSNGFVDCYKTVSDFKWRRLHYQKQPQLVVVTTYLSSLHLSGIFERGFFTHILLDEGAQAREPEAIAPFCMATMNTKIVIAGDAKQVGPALLVLGDDARENGLKISLLERLQNHYRKLGGVALNNCAVLLCNYRCCKELLALPSRLFYDSRLECHVPDIALHPDAPYPLLFVCSSLDNDLCFIKESVNENEASVLLKQVKKFTTLKNWPHQWGERDLSRVCIVTQTRGQVSVMRRIAVRQGIKGIQMLPTYDIQGREFQAVFLSTSEPTRHDSPGASRNPTKSASDPYVFNTVITRAQSLVVCVGNPFMLLKTENHMVAKYGKKAKCWSEYLRLCLQHNTLFIPLAVKLKTSEHDKCVALLRQLTRIDTHDQQRISAASKSSSHGTIRTTEHTAISSLNQRVTSQQKPVQATSIKQSAWKEERKGVTSQQKLDQAASNKQSAWTEERKGVTSQQKPEQAASIKQSAWKEERKGVISQHKQDQAARNTSNKHGAWKKENPTLQPEQAHPPNKKLPTFPSQQGKQRAPTKGIFGLEDFPSLEQAREQHTPKKKAQREQQRTSSNTTLTKVARKTIFSDFYEQHKDNLDVAVLQRALTRETYKEKFHHLLCWEEMEHERLLAERCDGIYTVTVYQPGFKLITFEDNNEGEHVRHGLLSHKDGDVISYAKQASQGAFITLGNGSQIHANWIWARVPKGEDGITIGLTREDVDILIKYDRHAKSIFQFEAHVSFELRHFYFQGQHNALDKITAQVIDMIMPTVSDFKDNSLPAIKPKPKYAKPEYADLELDKTGQMQALHAITSSCSNAPILVVGPFGTGKTRLLARAAYQILRSTRHARVLVCAHHQASVDTFVEYFGRMKDNPKNPWHVNLVRLIPKKNYRSNTRDKYGQWYKTRYDIRDFRHIQLVVSTLGVALHLHQKVQKGYFTHILMDEGAQTREPESIGALSLASKETKIVIAGDHFQVGPEVLVLGKEAQEYGLGVSLLERLHEHYNQLGRKAKDHCVTLLCNYRCHKGILMLPSSLFYGSTLQCRLKEDSAHPLAPYPLLFVCSSLDSDVQYVTRDTDEAEAKILLDQVSRFVKEWPSCIWNAKDLSQICVMTPSANQHSLLMKMIRGPGKYQHLRGVDVLKAYDIQGREYRAIFIGTSETTKENSEPRNPTKSTSDRYIFNTVITRAKSLVVTVGNPFMLLRIEKHMVEKYGVEGKCWSEYIRRCLECKTFYPPNDVSHAELQSKRDFLYNMIYGSVSTCGVTEPACPIENRTDSILHAYQKECEKIPEFRRAKLILSRKGRELTWNLKDNTENTGEEIEFSSKREEFVDEYACHLNIIHPGKAEALPLDHKKKAVTIIGLGNRKGAFDGDVVQVGVFRENAEGMLCGRITGVIEACGTRTFVCTVSHRDPVIFYPTDRKSPPLVNLPRLSRNLLRGHNKEVINEVLELSSEDVAVFDPRRVEGGLPQVKESLPLPVAQNLLFVVKFLQWNLKYRCPVGIVVAALPKGLSAFHAERLLKITYNVEFSREDASSNVVTLPTSVPRDETLNLYDRALTIDPENAKNLDDAISLTTIEKQPNGTLKYQLAVHIVNAAKYVGKETEEDNDARSKGISVYGAGEGKVMHMLPHTVRSRLSLLPNCIRDVLTVVCTVTFANDSFTVAAASVQEAQVKSCFQLTYKMVQEIMEDGCLSNAPDPFSEALSHYDTIVDQPTLAETLQLLYKIAFHLRQERLKSPAAYSYETNEEEASAWQAHLLVEELMIWANSVVAAKMFDAFTDCALLRKQNPPNDEKMGAVIGEISLLSGHSFYLQMFSPKPLSVAPVVIPHSVVREIFMAIESRNLPQLVYLLTADQKYPQLAVARAQLRSIFQRAEYCCTSIDDDLATYQHYSLKLDTYTHFTSPLRRYIDIEVQRMVTEILQHSPVVNVHARKESFQRLCKHLNSTHRTASNFEKAMESLNLALRYISNSELYDAFISRVSEGKVELCFPDSKMKVLSSKQKSFLTKHLGSLGKSGALHDHHGPYNWKIKMTSLKSPNFIFELPELTISEEPTRKDTRAKQASMKHDGVQSSGASQVPNVSIALLLNTDGPQPQVGMSMLKEKHCSGSISQNVIEIQPEVWQKALKFAATPTIESMQSLKNLFSLPTKSHGSAKPPRNTSVLTVYKLSRSLSLNDSVRVWMTGSTSGDILSPALQLLELAPGVHICLQHNTHPAECFSNRILTNASRKHYNSINEYVSLWEQVLLAEAAEKSVKECQPVIIRDATLKWSKLALPPNCIDQIYYVPQGSVELTLPQTFIENSYEFFKIKHGDLMCVRYGTDPHSDVRAVFHMVAHHISEEDRESARQELPLVKIKMKFVGTDNCRISQQMKGKLEEAATCELQVIRMSTSYRRVYQVLTRLTSQRDSRKPVSNLAHNVAMGRVNQIQKRVQYVLNPQHIFESDAIAKTLWSCGKRLNAVQVEAVRLALSNSFQLIQGPPGTGKSETGAHIAYVFAMLNRRLCEIGKGQGHCVLYCGPSNKAVDVVLENLHTLHQMHPEKQLRILRLYGRAVERRDFPSPFSEVEVKEESAYLCPEWAKNYSLHHMIRRATDNLACQELVKMEEEFRKYPNGYSPSSKTLKEYRKAIMEAEKLLLTEPYDIVLCTCNEASSARVLLHIHQRVKQCIIDECGMAYEPESMAPISLSEHAILLGDHKQLQPVIDYAPARENGLSTSLFQRYAERFEGQQRFCETLTIQYRMHKAICAFPSEYFYENRLQTDRSVKARTNRESHLEGFWPRGPNMPILFCNIVGKEGEYKTGSYGHRRIGIDSKCNEDEARKAVELAWLLHNEFRVSLDEIAIMTPYSAQKETIRLLAEKAKIFSENPGRSGTITIASVTESQGDEYGIVILSTVRSKPLAEIANPDHVQPDRGWLLRSLGFLTDEHQTNVGITRSKYGLAIVGNKRLLEYSETWKALIQHYQERGCVVSTHSFPPKRLQKKLPSL